MTVDLTRLVKPLVFEQCAAGLWSSGLDLGGEYRIKLTGGRGFQVSRGMLAIPDNTHWFQDLAAAQAAANADRAARVLAALDTEAIAALVEAFKRQSDNMAFVLNHMTMPNAHYEKFTRELEEDRAALARVKGQTP